MPIQIRLMSWNIQKKKTNASYIAALMRAYQIDIVALLEVPNSDSFTIPFGITTALDNLNPTYHQNAWKFKSVDVGDESVSYIWHDNGNPGQNAFRAQTYNNVAVEIAGKVTNDRNDARIYFPTTQFSWTGLPGKPAGRRPAYMVFTTNDGQAARTFSFLDLHTPFNPDTLIQAYSTHLYATAREIVKAETVDAKVAVSNAETGAIAALQNPVDTLLTSIANHATFIDPQKLRTEAVKGARVAIEETIDAEGTDLPTLFANAVSSGIDGAIDSLTGDIPVAITRYDATDLARACAMAGAVGATHLVSSIELPTAPPAATASVNAACQEAETAVTNETSPYRNPSNPSSIRLKAAIRIEAKRMARAAQLTFGAMPTANVTGAIVAGDFNVAYPDTTTYLPSQQLLLNNGNAYTRLLALNGGTTGALNQATSTRIGPTAFRGQRVYTLKNPCPIQHLNPGTADYVPLDVSSLANTDFMNWTAWVAGLQALAKTQSVPWAPLVATYGQRLTDAFDSQRRINDTSFYRANCYDNIFVRGVTVVQSGLIDVMSELGSWQAFTVPHPYPGLVPNPWLAAANGLNAIAQAQVGNAPVQFSYSTQTYTVTYTVNPTLDDGEQAAVFFDQYISDHLPVMVEIQI